MWRKNEQKFPKSLSRLRESPDYELCRISEQRPGVLEELAAERKKLLEKERWKRKPAASPRRSRNFPGRHRTGFCSARWFNDSVFSRPVGTCHERAFPPSLVKGWAILRKSLRALSFF